MYRVAGYVKLAKLWERSREEAIHYHNRYYTEKYQNDPQMDLKKVYIDITGNKEIYKRENMIRLMRDCRDGKIDVIALQTRAYLAPNTGSLCFVLKYLFDLPHRIDIVTEDGSRKIDTLTNEDGQRESLKAMAEHFVALDKDAYVEWCEKVKDAMRNID